MSIPNANRTTSSIGRREDAPIYGISFDKGSKNDTGYRRLIKFGNNMDITYSSNEIVVDVSPSTGGTMSIGVPTDGNFGNNYNLANILPSDSCADASDKLNSFIEKLVPTPPPEITGITISLEDPLYSAIISGTSTLVNNVQNNLLQRPRTNISPQFFARRNGFLESYTNTLSTPVPSLTGQIDLDPSNIITSGTNSGTLEIVNYSSVSGGIFEVIEARIQTLIPLVPSNSQLYFYELTHSDVGSANSISFYQDDAGDGSDLDILNQQIIAVNHPSGHYVSGVPALTIGDSVDVKADAINAIKKFYHPVWVLQFSGNLFETINVLPVGSERNEGSNPSFTRNVEVDTSGFSNGAVIECTVQNSASIQHTENATTLSGTIYIDSLSDESNRLESGNSAFDYNGNSYDETISLQSNRELQVIGGVYQYPPAIDYGNRIPSGPNYIGVDAIGIRYLTIDAGNFMNIDFVELEFLDPVGFGTTQIVGGGFELWVKIVGPSGTSLTGWIDGNNYYSGVGNPSVDGDPGLVFSGTTATNKRITLGTATYNGNVVVKVGLLPTTGITFTGINVNV